jgi:hypothetical protein
MKKLKLIVLLFALLSIQEGLFAQQVKSDPIDKAFRQPGDNAKPWVFWYWMHGAISKAGITADLEAMKQVGIGGAYLMPIKDTTSKVPFAPTARQLTPEFWSMVKHAMQEAKRLKLQLGVHVSDGFALAGGPWISPEQSMQKLVWTKTYVKGGSQEPINLSRPEDYKGFYKDVAVYAYPANCQAPFDDITLVPAVTTSTGARPSFLAFRSEENTESFKSDSTCWIQYKYPEAVTCRSITIKTSGNNYQALRLELQVSDGSGFHTAAKLEAPRHGWQDGDEDYTWSIPEINARYFRFVYNKEGSEPGAEDLDAAKWKPSLKIKGIYLNDEPVIHQYQAKNGSVWRVARNTYDGAVTVSNSVPVKSILNLTAKMDAAGNLNWKAPAGNWIIVRIGHTSQGHTNYTGGAGLGLECDKFSPAAVKWQLKNWFGEFYKKTDPVLAKQVLKVLHVDSWEAGSQNWTADFPAEFQNRRGYDLMPWLLTMTGVPVNSAETSEKILFDVRLTISELVNDVFYKEVKKEATTRGCLLSAEAIAPTMLSDGLSHYKYADLPMGEFWNNSPTHDKPNDMLDAISGAHIYGKNIVQAESFTTVRMDWSEHPGKLKALGDRQYALGINKLVFHVFTHNPWMDKKPGMTLDGVGLYFQRDQTWFKQSKAWMEYLSRCQALLQLGKPVTDIAVFTSDELPRRSVLPDRLVNVLPGLIGNERIENEKRRLENKGEPLRTIPDGVTHSANMADPENLIDPLNGYAYDSFNPDVLLQMKVVNGRVVTPGGASYALLVFPAKHPLNPNSLWMTEKVAVKILELLQQGANILLEGEAVHGRGWKDQDGAIRLLMDKIKTTNGKGWKFIGPMKETELPFLQKDVDVIKGKGKLAWNHRQTADADIYFISNQSNEGLRTEFILRASNKEVEALDPVTGEYFTSYYVDNSDKGIRIKTWLSPSQSLFFICKKKAAPESEGYATIREPEEMDISSNWSVQFDPAYGGPAKPVLFPQLKSWTTSADTAIRYYSGSAVYTRTIEFDPSSSYSNAWLVVDGLQDIASVKINGREAGTIWTAPYQLDISKTLKKGTNTIEITVSNTWHNRLILDEQLPATKRVTYTTAPFRLKDKPLLPAGITGSIKIVAQ